MDHPLEYRKPTELEIATMQAFNERLKAAYDYALAVAPDSRQRQECLTRLEEARMWFNAGIILNPAERS